VIQASDTVAADDGRSFVTTSDYPSYGGHFDASTGDGGEVYVVENGVVRISETQDGSKPGITYFVAKGGTGWLLFDNKVPTGSWRCETARVRAASSPDADVKLGPGLYLLAPRAADATVRHQRLAERDASRRDHFRAPRRAT
jgi:hypothetical protein